MLFGTQIAKSQEQAPTEPFEQKVYFREAYSHVDSTYRNNRTASGNIKSQLESVEQPDTLIMEPVAETRERAIIAFKTNLIGLATGIANFGMEYRLSGHYTFHLPARYSPYTISKNYRLRMLTFQPEVRYWFTESFCRHFVGLHPIGAFINVSYHSRTRYQTNRMAYGIGVSYGYSMPFRKRENWKLEFALGLGYGNADYDKYYNVHHGKRFDSDHREYWGITHASVNLVYLIKRRKNR